MKNIVLALIALTCILIPLGTEAAQPRLEARLAWDARNGFDFGVNIGLDVPLWRGF